MDRNKLFLRLTFLIVFIFMVNLLAMKFHWYSLLWWFDMPMHFLGGLWIGLLLLWIFPPKEPDLKSVFGLIFGVFLVGFGWEIFEVLVNNMTVKENFDMLDTISDLLFDISGAFMSLVYYFSRFNQKLSYI